MNAKEENICRLCLKVADNEFELIDEAAKHIFKVLLLRINFHISKDPIMCKDCKETSIKCFDFQSVCTATEERILSFATDKNRATLTLKDVSNDGRDIERVDDNFICRFCLKHLSERDFILLDTLTKDVKFAEKLQALLPVTDFDVIKNPVICIPCGQDVVCYVRFVENCLDVEEKISNYCRNDETPTLAQIKLGDVLQFLFKNILGLENSLIRGIKKEERILSEAHSEYIYDSELIKVEEDVDIKEHGVILDETVCEAVSETRVYELDISSELKSETEKGIARKVSSELEKGRAKYDLLSHDNVCEATIFKCASCTYETKCKNHLKSHMLIHKNNAEVETYKCPICIYETKHKSNLKIHTLIHKDVTEVDMHKCSTCSYETKRKSILKTHMLIHKDNTDVEMYKCSICIYETKHKSVLKTHLLIHKHVTEVEMYKCSTCTYETKRKSVLKRHTLIHRDVSDVDMYKCSTCTYETKHKNSLKSHMLIHRDIAAVVMHKCSMCSFQAKRKSSLNRHTLIHRDVTEVTMYKCSMCRYETKQKGTLKRHMLIHKDVIEPERTS